MEDDNLLHDPANPRLGELISEYRRCSPASEGSEYGEEAERIRFAQWDNQSADCRKHSGGDFKAMPWDGASDQRVLLADEIICEQVDVLVTAFDRVFVQAEALGAEDLESAGAAKRVLKWWMKARSTRDLRRNVEMSAQYLCTYGWCVINPVWERMVALKNVTLPLEEVSTLLGPDRAAALMDPAFDDEIAASLGELRQIYIAQKLDGIQDAAEIPPLRKSRLKEYVRQLREEREITLPLPYVCRNQPRIRALRPYYEVKLPEQQGDLQRGKAFVVEYMTVDQIHSYAISEGWNREWVEEVIKAKGSTTQVPVDASRPLVESLRAGNDTRFQDLIEVVTAYTWRLNDDLVPGIYVTVFSPHVTKVHGEEDDLVAKHGLLDYQHGQMPLVEAAREWWCASVVASRGIPELAFPKQRLMKVTEDSMVDRASITTLPPRLTPAYLMDMEDTFGPASRVPIKPGQEPRFMDIPARDGVAENIWQQSMLQVNRQFGRPSETVPQVIWQTRLQKLTSEFLSMWTEALQQAHALMLQYMTESEWLRIVGTPKPKVSPDAIGLESDSLLTLDIREMDPDFAMKQLEAIQKYVLPADSAGVVDRSKLVATALAAIHPGLARQLVQSKAGATQQLFQQVSADFASMALGNPPRLVEKDPTAAIQLQFAQQILQANQKYQAALREDQTFKKYVETWFQNRQQSVVQERNKTVGRLGVNPA
jgi:hypothetical protein